MGWELEVIISSNHLLIVTCLKVSRRAQGHSFGVLHLLHLPSCLAVPAGLLWMDLTFYYWRLLNHLQPLLALPQWQGFLASLSPELPATAMLG
jgi:hypothetical protein